MIETLIGFDARDIKSAGKGNWDTSHCETFLLKSDIDKILSADKSVWPSVSDVWKLELPAKTGWVQGLWANLDSLQDFVVASKPHSKSDYWTIGFTQFYDEAMVEETGLALLEFNPASIQKTWALLGYDVTEQTLLSGLSNMGYRDDDKLYAIDHFARHINQYHLFSDHDVAQEFAMWNQSRDSGHGPWFVTGIYRI